MKREVLKLATIFFGHYKVLDRIGNCSYKLELPISSGIHPVFNVSHLKKALFSDQVEMSLPPSALPTTMLKPLAGQKIS